MYLCVNLVFTLLGSFSLLKPEPQLTSHTSTIYTHLLCRTARDLGKLRSAHGFMVSSQKCCVGVARTSLRDAARTASSVTIVDITLCPTRLDQFFFESDRPLVDGDQFLYQLHEY